MIRDKKREFILLKNTVPRQKPNIQTVLQPIWIQSYYTQKDLQKQIAHNNQIIATLFMQYKSNPNVSALSHLNNRIFANNQLIQTIQSWINKIKLIPNLSTNNTILIHNICKHFTDQLSTEIKIQINNQQQLDLISRNLSQQSSFPQSSIKQVNSSIQNLNIILKRMNVVVNQQNDTLNRIDNNISISKDNTVKANKQLKQRMQKQQGQGEFSCDNRLNKIILGFYLLNVALILIFLIKNII